MDDNKKLHDERIALLAHIENIIELPISILGFVWLILLIIEMVHGSNSFLSTVSIVIWVLFVIDFLLRFIIAPQKIAYLKKNWLLALSLLIPAIRLFRVIQVIRIFSVLQASSIITMIGSVNRSMRSLNATLKRRGFVYVVIITIVVVLTGAAGMYAFERHQPGSFTGYGDAVWWTTMLLITIGSEYWPHTPAGKTLSVLISIYGFSVLGYITATLASFFVGRDAERPDGPVAGTDDIAALRNEIRELARKIDEMNKPPESPQNSA